MPTVRKDPAIGLIVQIVLLAGLAATVGLGPVGWLAGAAYGAALCLILDRGCAGRARTPSGRPTG